MKKVGLGIVALVFVAASAVFANNHKKAKDCCAPANACCQVKSSCCNK